MKHTLATGIRYNQGFAITVICIHRVRYVGPVIPNLGAGSASCGQRFQSIQFLDLRYLHNLVRVPRIKKGRETLRWTVQVKSCLQYQKNNQRVRLKFSLDNY